MLLDTQGFNVIVAVLSIFPEWLSWNRQNFTSYFEVFINTPIEVLEARDPKGIYAAARNGRMSQVVGIDIPFKKPAAPDLTLEWDDLNTAPSDIAALIIKKCNLMNSAKGFTK